MVKNNHFAIGVSKYSIGGLVVFLVGPDSFYELLCFLIKKKNKTSVQCNDFISVASQCFKFAITRQTFMFTPKRLKKLEYQSV